MPAQGKRRALGQHFLKDRSIATLIAQTAVENALKLQCRTLLEVGPGKGAITLPIQELLARTDGSPHLILSEMDREFAASWAERGARVEIGDFMDLPEERWLADAPVAVASNLPYSAGTAIVARLARHPEKIPFMVLMFQAEVAHRLRAEPNSKAWGSLSVWIQNRWDVRKLCAVPPGAFAPPPEVDSEVVTLVPRTQPRVSVPEELEARWEGLLKACFSHRRKMLRAGLPKGTPYFKALEKSGVDPTLRAEALTWDDWNRLFQALQQNQKGESPQ